MEGRFFTINASGDSTPCLRSVLFQHSQTVLGSITDQRSDEWKEREREKMDELRKGRKMNERRESEGKEEDV